MLIEGKKCTYEIVIGLEVHVQICTKTKLFSSAAKDFASSPNTNVDFFDLAAPGVLPVVNMEAINHAIKTGLAINGNISRRSYFDRKNYFYPDLPAGYQITQMNEPIVRNGYIDIMLNNEQNKRIGIDRIHLEQDAGKLVHDNKLHITCIDLNRYGVPLMEIVSQPDMRSPEEVEAYLKALRYLLKCIKTSNADMEKGSFRCDVNVSIRPIGSNILGTRCEIKNINSFRFIREAIVYEAGRQVKVLDSGDKICQETRLFNQDNCTTVAMRKKENVGDYRYFPDPDLLPIILEDSQIDAIRATLPELPDAKRSRYVNKYNMTHSSIDFLLDKPIYCDYFDTLVAKYDAKMCLTWLTVELCGRLNKIGSDLQDSNVKLQDMDDLLNFISSGIISGKIAKSVLDIMVDTGKNPDTIIEEEKFKQIDDVGVIEKIIDQIINSNAERVTEYKAGKVRLFGFFVGEVMKAMAGNCNPSIVNTILKEKLK